jgi:hypothetical protein
VVVDIAGSNPKALMKTVVMGGACRPDHFFKKRQIPQNGFVFLIFTGNYAIYAISKNYL